MSEDRPNAAMDRPDAAMDRPDAAMDRPDAAMDRPDAAMDQPDAAIDTARQHRALAHPMRHRLLIALGAAPATVSQLARDLDVRKGSVAHHLAVLVDAGLVRAGEARQVRGGTEQYYARATRVIRMDGAHAQTAAAMLTAVGEEVASATDEPLLHLRYVRLTGAQAAELRETLDHLVGDLDDAGEGEERFGVLVSLYRPA